MIFFSLSLKRELLEDDEALLLKKIELDKLSCTSRGSTVWLFIQSAEGGVANTFSSQVSFCISLAWITFSMSFALLSLERSIGFDCPNFFGVSTIWFHCWTQSNSIHGLGSIVFDWVRFPNVRFAIPGLYRFSTWIVQYKRLQITSQKN